MIQYPSYRYFGYMANYLCQSVLAKTHTIGKISVFSKKMPVFEPVRGFFVLLKYQLGTTGRYNTVFLSQ
jgi:hypothetical protein